MAQTKKVENFEKVREYVKNLNENSLTNYQIQQKFGLNYTQTAKILCGLVEINELKYIESLKIYVKQRVTKMLHAVNTLRENKSYSSLKVFLDLSLQQTENNRWIAPSSEVESYGEFEKGTEILLSYIKGTTRERNGTIYEVTPFFRKHPKFNSVKLKKPDKTHTLIVDIVYNLLLTDKIKDINLITSQYYLDKSKEDFYYTKLSELDIDFNSVDYEVVIESEDNQKRADIFIKFNKVNDIYGKGICFEIQLTKQKTKVTSERTYQRALLVLSTIWIFKQDILVNKDDLIIPKSLTISPYINVLNTTLKNSSDNIIKNYETQGILLDLKIDEFKQVIDNKVNEVLEKTKAVDSICLKCGKGYIKQQKGKYGLFLSCTNYSECKKLKW